MKSRQFRIALAVFSGMLTIFLGIFGQQTLAHFLGQRNSHAAVFTVDAYKPTETKAQSKIWYAQGAWWAILADGAGNSVWQRTAEGWRRYKKLDEWASNLVGVADIYSEGGEVYVALAGRHLLTFAGLKFDERSSEYVPSVPIQEWKVSNENSMHNWTTKQKVRSRQKESSFRGAESVTLDRSAEGLLWMTYSVEGQIFVKASEDRQGLTWGMASVVDFVQSSDDISSIYQDSDGMAVVWTDQASQAIRLAKFHLSEDNFQPSMVAKAVVAEGNKTADDHLNIARNGSGLVCIATKNDYGVTDYPSLTLRCKVNSNQWVDFNYANLTKTENPSRPIVMSIDGSDDFVLAHVVREIGFRQRNRLMAGTFDAKTHDISTSQVFPTTFNITNVTGTKTLLPKNDDWIVLTSDRFGNVFEAVLQKQ